MTTREFEELKSTFMREDTDGKINLYVEVKNLEKNQYKELLRYFPLEYLDKLERALY